MKGRSRLCSQTTGGVENAVPLHADSSCTSGRGSDLPYEAVLQEYLQFPHKYFLSVLLLGVALQTTPEEKTRKD
jgi:hypothetical protein